MIDNYKVFKHGVHSALIVKWRLTCETPLVIRNGKAISYQDSALPKNRGQGLKITWAESTNADYEVAALHYGYEIVDGKAIPYHFVPPSSVRGALRSWTIRHLGSSELAQVIIPIPADEKVSKAAYINDLRENLEHRRNSFELIGSLFGLAFEALEGDGDIGNAGRLRVETEKFDHAEARPISATGGDVDAFGGPSNAKRQFTVRNPLDRISHASKEGGLHHFLEFCAGESFNMQLSVLNPRGCDLGLLSLWKREMTDGLLRLGALSNIGRGRVSIAQEDYALWKRKDVDPLEGMTHFSEAVDVDSSGEALAGLWKCHTLPADKLSNFEQFLEAYVG